ncbi:MAG: amidohydrolase family protein [Candidatus Hadarchaeum sp.]|uniref:amidohydrolase family protein n=1 Tax=Candidatus Hadarchaeum sp. TaxID=2883567 RepID=UPI0031728573
MAREILSNAVILTGRELEITRGYMVIEDDVIKEISEGSPQRRAVNLNGGFIIPPFINAHTHVVDSVAKELYLGKNQTQVVGPQGLKFRVLERSAPVQKAQATKATLQDMLATGTLAHCDFREEGVDGVNFLRGIILPPLTSIILGRFSKVEEMLKVLSISDGLGIPSLDAFSEEVLEEASVAAREAKKFFAVHVAENAHEVLAFKKKHHRSEVEQAIKLRFTFVVHATHCSEEELLRLKANKTPVVFCARSNSLLGVGVPPINLALKTGTEFFLGTDNAMVCQPDMFEEISFAWRCLRRDNTAAGSEEAKSLLAAATVKPLSLFNLPWGPVEEGQKATFLILARKSNLLHLSDVYAGLVNRARADNIRAIYFNGKIIIS